MEQSETTFNQTKPAQSVILRVYDDGRKALSMHRHFKPSPKREIKHDGDKSTRSGMMTTRCYVRNIKDAHKKLFNRNYNISNCYNITLTTRESLPIPKMQYHFRRFMEALEYHYGNIEYVRAFECHKFIPNYHIHAILQFDEFPLDLRQDTIARIWKLGIVNLQKTYNIYGAIQYITHFKKQQLCQREIIMRDKKYIIYDEYHVQFPQGTKVISISQNFGVECNDTQFTEYRITAAKANQLIDEARQKNKFVRIEGHYYGYDHFMVKDKLKARLPYCRDRIYIQAVDKHGFFT